MNSLPFSLSLCTPIRKQNLSTSYTCSVQQTVETTYSQPKVTRIPSQSGSNTLSLHAGQESESKGVDIVVGRRGAVVAGVVAGVVGVVSQLQVGEASEVSSCEFTKSPSGLAFCDKLVGVGPQAAAGQLIKAHYVGKLENGKVFDSSYSRGKPLTFRVGVGEVIKGWDQGILGTEGVPPMLAGGKRTLRIPPELGYGMRGAGCRGGTCIIPPNSMLFFDVEFIGKA